MNSIAGVFRCGPASLNAIKNGEVYLPYDTGFIFAEVNGDRVYWDVDDDDGSMKAGYVDKYSIGRHISTKEPGRSARLDVTNCYKYREGWCVEFFTVNRKTLTGPITLYCMLFVPKKCSLCSLAVVCNLPAHNTRLHGKI